MEQAAVSHLFMIDRFGIVIEEFQAALKSTKLLNKWSKISEQAQGTRCSKNLLINITVPHVGLPRPLRPRADCSVDRDRRSIFA